MKYPLLAAMRFVAAGAAPAQTSGDITVESVWTRATTPTVDATMPDMAGMKGL